MRGRAILVACTAALAFAAPALAAPPHLAPSDRAAVNRTLDIFVNHAVKRHDPAGAYDVLTPTMKAGLTQQQWSSGEIPSIRIRPPDGASTGGRSSTGRGTSWRSSSSSRRPPSTRAKLGQILFHVYLHPAKGRWLVDSFMPGATFAPIGKPGVVQAARDFQANPSANTYNRVNKVKPTNPIRISAKYAVIPFAIVLLALLGLAARGIAENIRFRRLAAEHARSEAARRLACRVMDLELGRVTDRKPPFKFSSLTRVGFSDTDAQGIVYYGRYMPYFDRPGSSTTGTSRCGHGLRGRLRDARDDHRVPRARAVRRPRRGLRPRAAHRPDERDLRVRGVPVEDDA